MKPILKFIKNYKLECFLAPFFKLLEACFDLFVPIVVKAIIDIGIEDGRNEILEFIIVVQVVSNINRILETRSN